MSSGHHQSFSVLYYPFPWSRRIKFKCLFKLHLSCFSWWGCCVINNQCHQVITSHFLYCTILFYLFLEILVLWQALHHPFTAPNPEDMKDLSSARALAYDMVYNGVEVLGPVSLKCLRTWRLCQVVMNHVFFFFCCTARLVEEVWEFINVRSSKKFWKLLASSPNRWEARYAKCTFDCNALHVQIYIISPGSFHTFVCLFFCHFFFFWKIYGWWIM